MLRFDKARDFTGMVTKNKEQNLYSYVRWSSEKQGQGTSHVRQVTQARQFAIEHGLNFVEILDSGVSAFRGKNTTQGKLGDFIAAVEAGAIPSDSWLYVENLDRLSRQAIIDSQELFLKLLRLGLTIVTGLDNKVYAKGTVNDNPTDLMLSILLFSRAHEESKTKADRTNKNALALIERHRAGQPANIKSIGKHPFWIDDSCSQYESVKLHDTYAPAAQKAIELFMQGWGSYKVKSYLDVHYPCPPVQQIKNTSGTIRPVSWSIQALRKMRDNPALFGQRVISIQDRTYTLDNYYPPLISETEFIKLKNLKKNNKINCGKQYSTISLLSGLNILKCGCCQGPMTFFTHRNKIRYVCENGKSGKDCTSWSMDGSVVERLLVYALFDSKIMLTISSGGNDYRKFDLEKLESELQGVEAQIENFKAVIAGGVNLEAITQQLLILQNKREEIKLLISKAKEQNSRSSLEQINSNLSDFVNNYLTASIVNDIKDPKRMELREIVRSMFQWIVLEKANNKSYTVVFISVTGSHLLYKCNLNKLSEPVSPLHLSTLDLVLRDKSKLEKMNESEIKSMMEKSKQFRDIRRNQFVELQPLLSDFKVLNKEMKARK